MILSVDLSNREIALAAMSRKNGILDVFRFDISAYSTAPVPPNVIDAELLCSIKEERMRIGADRWIGLAFMNSCTSSGAFRYVELSKFDLLTESDGVLTLNQLNEPELDSATFKWTVPGPLYHVAFYPDLDSSPSYFAYGGEHVPLSLWSIRETLEYYKKPSSERGHAKAKAADDQSGEGGTGKRKSPTSKGSKALNLHPGEIWRARNHPNIRFVMFLPKATTSELHENKDSRAESALEDFATKATIAVGTKDGIIRLYEPAKNKNRHVGEWQVVPKNQGSIRVMTYCAKEQYVHRLTISMIFVGDTTQTLYAVDSRNGRVLFHYKVLVVPSSVASDNEGTEESKEEPLVLASSLDRLIYLLDLGTPRGTQRSRGKTLYSYFTGLEHVTTMVLLSKPVDEAAQDDDTFWGGMTVVGDNVQTQESEDEEPEKAPKRRRS